MERPKNPVMQAGGWAVSLGKVREVDTSSWLMHVEEHGLEWGDPYLERLVLERHQRLAAMRQKGMPVPVDRKAPVLVLLEAKRA